MLVGRCLLCLHRKGLVEGHNSGLFHQLYPTLIMNVKEATRTFFERLLERVCQLTLYAETFFLDGLGPLEVQNLLSLQLLIHLLSELGDVGMLESLGRSHSFLGIYLQKSKKEVAELLKVSMRSD